MVDSEEYEIKPQRIFYVAPKQVHNWSLYDGTQGYIIFIDQQAGLDMNLTYGFPYIDIDDTALLSGLIFPKWQEGIIGLIV